MCRPKKIWVICELYDSAYAGTVIEQILFAVSSKDLANSIIEYLQRKKKYSFEYYKAYEIELWEV